MLKVTFNKPAVDMFMDGPETKIRGLEVRLGAGNAIAFGPRRVASDTKVFKNIVAISMQKRCSVAAYIDGTMLDEVTERLRNPHGNPFFLLRNERGWIVPIPYQDQKPFIGRKSEPPRMTPHMRVWSGNMHRGMTPYMMETSRATMALVSDLLIAMKTIQEFYSRATIGRPSYEVEDAFRKLKSFEALARLIFPNFESNLFSGPSVTKEIGKRLLALNLESVIYDLPDEAFVAAGTSMVNLTSDQDNAAGPRTDPPLVRGKRAG